MSKLKEQLYLLCREYIKNKETEIRKAIAEAQEAANDETRSSAGDKFETGRETMQQEVELNLTRLNELNVQKTALDKIIPAQKGDTVAPGSVVYTSNGNYYISIGAGKLKVDETSFYAISIASPVGAKLEGQKAGYEFTMNGKKIVIGKVV